MISPFRTLLLCTGITLHSGMNSATWAAGLRTVDDQSFLDSNSTFHLAQSITPATDGTGTVVNQLGNQINIEGGTVAGENLFHSFEQLNVNPEEIANFLSQPEIQNILGRVVGGNPSVINGLLQVTGGNANLFLINPAGVIFGPESQVFVPGTFTVTTADAIEFDDHWFNAVGTNDYANLVGEPSGFVFTSSDPGAVINAGTLSLPPGESVTLLGGFVLHTGTIETQGGTVTIAAVPGENLVRISQAGSLLSLDLPIQYQTDIPQNSQPLTASEIPALLSGAAVPNDLGVIVDDGVVKLVNSDTAIPTSAGTAIASGTVDAGDATDNGMGGSIDILGSRIGLIDANLAASGSRGGGTIRVGGDYQGQGTIPNAEYTYINAGSTIAADALIEGDAGRVIVWANEATQFYGDITARGEGVTGAGGFVEVSGHESLAFHGQVDVTAPSGSFGTLLLDPRNIFIVAGDASPNDSALLDDVEGLSEITAVEGGNSDFTISASILEQQKGEIILQANESIEIETGLSLSFAEFFFPRNPISFQADVDGDGLGSFVMDTNQTLSTAGRPFTITGSSILAGTISTQAESSNFGALTLNATSGNIEAQFITAGEVTLTAMASSAPASPLLQQGDIVVEAINASGLEVQASGLFRVEGSSGVVFSNYGDSEPRIVLEHGGIPVNLEAEFAKEVYRFGILTSHGIDEILIRIIGGESDFGFVLEDGIVPLPEGVSGIRGGFRGNTSISSTDVMGVTTTTTTSLFTKPNQGMLGNPRIETSFPEEMAETISMPELAIDVIDEQWSCLLTDFGDQTSQTGAVDRCHFSESEENENVLTIESP